MTKEKKTNPLDEVKYTLIDLDKKTNTFVGNLRLNIGIDKKAEVQQLLSRNPQYNQIISTIVTQFLIDSPFRHLQTKIVSNLTNNKSFVILDRTKQAINKLLVGKEAKQLLNDAYKAYFNTIVPSEYEEELARLLFYYRKDQELRKLTTFLIDNLEIGKQPMVILMRKEEGFQRIFIGKTEEANKILEEYIQRELLKNSNSSSYRY